jgi:hypothetical protein
MLNIITTATTAGKREFSASIRYLTKGEMSPDVTFMVRSFKKCSTPEKGEKTEDWEDESDSETVKSMYPANLFFNKLTDEEQGELYDMYVRVKDLIGRMNLENYRVIQDLIRKRVTQTLKVINIANRLVEFAADPIFLYPDLTEAGKGANHTEERTYHHGDYLVLTGISILSKIVYPICGEIHNLPRIIGDETLFDMIGLDIIEPTLESGPFGPVYNKLQNTIRKTVTTTLERQDKALNNQAQDTRFVLSHSGGFKGRFIDSVIAHIITRRMASFSPSTMVRGKRPNAMVFIDNAITRSTVSKIAGMKKGMTVVPRWELSSGDGEQDNASMLDHISRSGSRPIDYSVITTVSAERHVIPKMLALFDTPIDVYLSALEYYRIHPFEISCFTQSMAASFAGMRFGGSKCLNWLPNPIYVQLVTIMQIWMVQNGLHRVASLCSAINSEDIIDAADSTVPIIAIRERTPMEKEYTLCESLFRGNVTREVAGSKRRGAKKEVETIGFRTLISGLVEWLGQYSHKENMAPSIWKLRGEEDYPIHMSECTVESTIMVDVCRYYLMMHSST